MDDHCTVFKLETWLSPIKKKSVKVDQRIEAMKYIEENIREMFHDMVGDKVPKA